MLEKITNCFKKKKLEENWLVYLNGKATAKKHSPNLVRNQKYNLLTFVPVVLYNQFKFFFNLFYLLIALSQFVPPLKVGIKTHILVHPH